MPEITAASVNSLRKRTGLPMMKCKQALQETGGDEDAAVEYLRKQGIKTSASDIPRETDFGRMGLYTDMKAGVGAMVELKCESAPVAGFDEFIQLASDLAKQLATGPGAATADELLAQPSPSKKGQTLKDQLDDLALRIREVFRIGRMIRIDAPTGGYVHHAGKTVGVLAEVTGGNPEAAKEICMHIAAMSPTAVNKEDLPEEEVNKEREILSEAARQEGKPENIIAKMVEGRLRNYYSERVLMEQPFVKDNTKTVGQVAKEANMKITRFVHWILGS